MPPPGPTTAVDRKNTMRSIGPFRNLKVNSIPTFDMSKYNLEKAGSGEDKYGNCFGSNSWENRHLRTKKVGPRSVAFMGRMGGAERRIERVLTSQKSDQEALIDNLRVWSGFLRITYSS